MRTDVATSSGELAQRVKPGKLFRSGLPEGSYGPVPLNKFLTFDLRSPEEIDPSIPKSQHQLWSMLPPDGRKLSYGERYEQLAVGKNLDEVVSEDYFKLFQTCRPLFMEAFDLASLDAERKIWVYCREGKDRTGIFVALLLSLLGISMHSIEKDYLRAVKSARLLAGECPADWQAYLGLIYPGSFAIRSFIERIERSFGSVDVAIWEHDLARGARSVALLRAKLLRE